MSEKIISSSKEASRGGFQGIKKVRGILTDWKKTPSKFTKGDFGEPKEQIEVNLTDAAILEMMPNEDEVELKDGTFKFWIPYAVPGKIPNTNSIFTRCWVASAEAIGIADWKTLKGQYITLERRRVVLFKTDKDDKNKQLPLNPDGSKTYREVTTDKYFCFVKDESNSEDIKEYIVKNIVGKNEKAAGRFIVMDNRTQQFPEYKEAVKANTIPSVLPVKLVDGVFQKV